MRSTSVACAIVGIVASVITPAPALSQHGQSATTSIDSLIAGLEPARLDVIGLKGLKGATTVIIPGTLLHLAMDGTIKASGGMVMSTLGVRANYRVRGISETFASQLSARVEGDLRQRLSSAGFRVLTHADVAAAEGMKSTKQLNENLRYGAPTINTTAPEITFATIAPSPAQLFAGGVFNKHKPFRNLAREMNAVVIVPELFLATPQSTRGSRAISSLTIPLVTVNTNMSLMRAGLTFITPSGATGSITLSRAIENIGLGIAEMVSAGSDSARAFVDRNTGSRYIGDPTARLPARFANSSGSFDLMIHEQLYEAGVLLGAAAFFKAAVAAIEGAKE
jgi:hypothetical protein